MAEPKISDYCYYLPELFEIRSIVRHQVYRIVGVTSNRKHVVPLTQLQPPNIVDRAPISAMRLIEIQHRIDEQQKKIDNSEMLGTAGARLEEELRQLQLESQRLGDQLLETKRQLEYAGNQRESCRRQVETIKKELEEITNVAETKTRECIALVDERECLARELENAEIDKRKLWSRVRTEQTSKKVIQRRLEAINAQSPFSQPPKLYELLFLPQGPQSVLSRIISKHWQCSVIRTRVVVRTCSKSFFKRRKLWKTRRPVIFMTSTGLIKHKNI